MFTVCSIGICRCVDAVVLCSWCVCSTPLHHCARRSSVIKRSYAYESFVERRTGSCAASRQVSWCLEMETLYGQEGWGDACSCTNQCGITYPEENSGRDSTFTVAGVWHRLLGDENSIFGRSSSWIQGHHREPYDIITATEAAITQNEYAQV